MKPGMLVVSEGGEGKSGGVEKRKLRSGRKGIYSGKFSRGPIFAVFAVSCQSTKIKPSK